MIPRLKPKSSFRRPSGIENVYPIDTTTNVDTSLPPILTDTVTSTSSVSSFAGRSENYNRPLSTPNDESPFPKQKQMSLDGENQPLSPSRSTMEYDEAANSPVPNDYGNQHKHLLLNYSSSTPNSFERDGSSISYSDFSLTPPTAGSRPPLLVSARRYGSEVRRQHSKRRRRRRRPSSTRPESEKRSFASGMSVNPTSRDSRKEIDNDAFCLWKGDA